MNGLTRRDLLAAGLALGVAPIANGIRAHARQQGGRTIEGFFREVTDDWVRHDPTLASTTRFFHGDGQDKVEGPLAPRAVEWRRDRIRRARTALVELGRFDRSGLSDVLRVSADLLQWQLAAIVESEPFLDFTFPLEQMNGANVTLVDSFTIRRTVQTDRDAENYVATLPQVAMSMDESTEDARRLADRKVIPPRFILAATIRQMRAFADMRPAQNPFVATFADRLSAIRSLAPARRRQLQTDAEKILVAEVYPAWKRAIELLEGQLAQATDDAGLWRLLGGPDAYAYFLRYFTTTPRTANDIHEIGLMQVSRLQAEMDRLLCQIRRTDRTVQDL